MNTLLNILNLAAAGLGIYICLKLALCLLMDVPAYTSILILNRLTKSVRACQSGWRIIWPWEEKIDGSEVAMEISNHTFTNDFETQDEIVVSLKISFDTMPDERHLREYRRFDSATRLSGITERIKSILSVEVRKLKTRDDVMNSYTALANEVKKRFEEAFSEDGKRLEEYYGANLKKLVIADDDLPPALKEASTAKEVMAKTNEMRQMDVGKLKQMAKSLVREAKEQGHDLPYATAWEIIQLQFGKGNVSKDIKIFGLDPRTQDLLKSVVEGVLSGKR